MPVVESRSEGTRFHLGASRRHGSKSELEEREARGDQAERDLLDHPDRLRFEGRLAAHTRAGCLLL